MTSSGAQKPTFYTQARFATFGDDCHAKCPDCRGHGSTAGFELETCAPCQAGQQACEFHACRRCAGSGAVCPACGGDRFVRKRPWAAGVYTVDLIRCETCCEGNQVSITRERRAIDKYLLRFFPATEDEQREARHAEHAATQEDAQLYHADWMERTRSLYGKKAQRRRMVEAE